MQYNQPYGVSDPNAPYVNGDPSIGRAGSIPPAASIEYPQREIVNFILKSNLVPDNADLFQLGESVQSGLVNYGTDNGDVNRIQITPTLPVTAYKLGQRFLIKLKYGNTSTVQVNISGVGWAPLIHTDLTPINAWELLAGQMLEIAYDGANFQLLSTSTIVMNAPRHLYVSDNIGDDSLYDGTSAAISGTNTGPFKTVQKALATMKKYNLGGWDFYIHVADGGYVSSASVDFPVPNGSGTVRMIGNISNPAAVSVQNAGPGTCWKAVSGGSFYMEGFTFTATQPAPGDGGHALWWMNSSSLELNTCNFGSVPGSHFTCGPTASALVFGTIRIKGPCGLGGGGGAHFHAYANGTLYNNIPSPNQPTLSIDAAVSIPTFILASNGGQARPMYETINGAANVTGQKFVAQGNGVIDTEGRGQSYLPGTIAGQLFSGGQYL